MAPPSILFTPQTAAEQDEAFVHSIGLNGLLELIALDPTLASYEHSLFSEASLQITRRMQTDEANQKLDRTIEGFLGVLSRHFLSHAAQKALEFLLRHYRVHRHNTVALLRCILPYHATRLFVRVAVLLHGDEKRTGWLRAAGGVKLSVPPPRSLFVQHAAKDTQLMEQILGLGATHPIAQAFSTVMTLEIAGKATDDRLCRTLLDNARTSLTSQASVERQLSGMLLIVQLCCRQSLAAEPVRLLAELIAARLRQAESAAESRHYLQCLLVLYRLPPLSAAARGISPWPSLFRDPDGGLLDAEAPSTKALFTAVTELCSRHDVSALLRPLLLQLAGARTNAPHAAARILLTLPLRSLARPIAALLVSLEASEDSRPVAQWLWRTVCAGGDGDAIIDGAPGGDELSAIERLRSLQNSNARGAVMSKEVLLRRLGDCRVVAAGAVAMKMLQDELSTDELHRALLQQLIRKRVGAGSDSFARAVFQLLAETGAARLAVLPGCLELHAQKSDSVTLPGCLAEFFGPPSGKDKTISSRSELYALCGLLMLETSEPVPILKNISASIEGSEGKGRRHPTWDVASLDIVCDAALHLCRRISSAEDWVPASTIRAQLDRLALGVLNQLPASSLLEASEAVQVSRKAFVLLCGDGRGKCNTAGLRKLFSQHWKAGRLLLMLATCWASSGHDRARQSSGVCSPAHQRQWRALRLRALQLTRVILEGARSSEELIRLAAHRLLPFFLTVVHGTDALLSAAASAVLAILREAVGTMPTQLSVSPPLSGIQAAESPLVPLGSEGLNAALDLDVAAPVHRLTNAKRELLTFLANQYAAMLSFGYRDSSREQHASRHVRDSIIASGLALIRSLLQQVNSAESRIAAPAAEPNASRKGDRRRSAHVIDESLSSLVTTTRSLLLAMLQFIRASCRTPGLGDIDGAEEGAGRASHALVAEATALSVDLLGLYSAATVAALPPSEQVASLAMILLAITLPWGKEMPLVATAIPIAALQQVTPQLFDVLGLAEREQVLTTLCSSRRHALSLKRPPLALLAQGSVVTIGSGRTALKAVAAASSLLEQTMQETLASLPLDAHMLTRRLVTCTSSLRESASNEAPDASPTADVADVIAILEIQGRLRSMPEPRAALVEPLFDLLEAVCTMSEYCTQLVLTELVKLVRDAHLATNVDTPATGFAAAVVARFSTHLLSELAVDAERPQVARHAIDVIAAAVPLLPLDVLADVIPHLADVSQRSLKDGQLSVVLPSVQRALRVLLPLLVERGLELRPLLRGWVRMVLRAPPAQWGSLLGTLVNESASVGHLHCVVSSLVAAHVLREPQGPDARASLDDLLRLAHSLCGTAPLHVRLHVCAQLILCSPILPGEDKYPAAAPVASIVSPGVREAHALSVATLAFVREHLERHGQRAKRAAGPNPEDDTAEVRTAAHELFSSLVLASELSRRSTGEGAALSAPQAAMWSAVRRHAQESLLALNLLMPAAFLQPIAELLAHTEPTLQNLAVVLLQARLQRKTSARAVGLPAANLPSDELEHMVNLTASLIAAPGIPGSTRAALLAFDLLARDCGSFIPEPFESTMPALMRHVAERNPIVITSALLACSALLSTLGVRLVAHMPVFMPPLLGCLEATLSSSEPGKDDLQVAAAWLDGCGAALLSTLAMFLHPYLPRLLRCLLRLAELDTPAARSVELGIKAQAVGRALARAIPARQLLPAMVDTIGVAAQAGAPAQVELIRLLQTHVTLRPPTEARSHHGLVFQLLLSGLVFRSHQVSSNTVLLEAPAAVEAITGTALADVVMRLDEEAFGVFFSRSLRWARVESDSSDAVVVPLSLPRALSFFRVMHATQALLRSLFAPYFALALPFAISCFGARQQQPIAADGAKRRRIDVTENDRRDIEVALNMALIHSIELGFSNEPEKPPVEQLRTLEKALITRLSWQPHATLLPALLGAIGALATYLGVDGCKPLHYELCMATQAEDEVQRRSAVRGLQKLYAVLPDAVLVHSPEAVPFLSELLEDSDPEARAHALDLLNTLEQSNAGLLEED